MSLTLLDFIDQAEARCNGVPLHTVEIKFKLNGNGGVLDFSLRKKRRSLNNLTHDLIVYNRNEKSEDIHCPECGGIVVAGCSGYCPRCYVRFTSKGSLGL